MSSGFFTTRLRESSILKKYRSTLPPAIGKPIAVFTYVSDGDANGIFTFIGKNYLTGGVWSNPYTLGNIDIVRSGTVEAGTVTMYVDHTANSTHTNNVAGNWVAFDLGLAQFRSAIITKYSLQNRNSTGRAMRNWKLQGTNSAASNSIADLAAATWTDIDVRTNDTTMSSTASSWGTYTVSGTPSDYRYLRILNTGVNSDADFYLIFGEIEFYGIFYY